MGEGTDGRGALTLGRKQLAAAALAVVLLTVGAGAVGAGVSQSFVDVSPSHPFFDDIEGIVAAGITEGYPDDTYRPGAPVSRGAMAAFMSRGFSRIEQSYGNGGGTDAAPLELTGTQHTSPATGAGTGVVAISASVDAEVTAAGIGTCPCSFSMWIEDGAGDRVAGLQRYATVPGAPTSDHGFNYAAASLTAVDALAAGETEDYTLVVRVEDDDATMTFYGEISSIYAPFGQAPGAPV